MARQETIRNEGPVSSTALTVYEVPDFPGKESIGFLQSDSLEEIEEGIRRTRGRVDFVDLYLGIAIVKVEREGLWQQAGFKNLWSYRREMSPRLNMPSASISMLRRRAEAWLDHAKDLKKLPLDGNISKLRFFNQALEKHGDKRLVLKHFKDDSLASFAAFARPERKPELPAVKASIRAGLLYVDDKPVARFDEGLPEGEREFFAYFIKNCYQVRSENMIPHLVPVYGQGEARAIDNFLKKFRAGK